MTLHLLKTSIYFYKEGTAGRLFLFLINITRDRDKKCYILEFSFLSFFLKGMRFVFPFV